MTDEMQYLVSTLIPSAFAKWECVVVGGGKLKDKIEVEKPKYWPGMMEENSACRSTAYKIDQRLDTINNSIEANLEVINSEKPRIEWNIFKRNYMTGDAVRHFLRRLKQYRHLPLEVYVTSAKDDSVSAVSDITAKDLKGKAKSDVSSKSDKGKKGPEKGAKKDVEDYLHLMSIVNASTLLYPGVNKYRIACPLNTYHETEILQEAGQEKSYFMPSLDERPPSPGKDDKKGGGKSDKDSKSGKGDKGTAKDSNKNDLRVLLPSPPPFPLEPSTPVYDQTGQRTFIILEIEFLKPLYPKREIEDLSEQLSNLLPPKPEMSKIIMSSRLANLYFRDVIKQLTVELVHQHQHYLRDKERCRCDREEAGDSQSAFRIYLQRSGVYHTYFTSITKAASVIVNDKLPYTGDFNRNSKEYQNFIAEVYSYLITEMNGVLNELTSSGAESSPKSPLMGLDSLLLYAREASAIGANLLADRYYLERIARDHTNGDYWFDYAVFQLEIGDKQKALECVKQCLVANEKHCYGLLLCGILLSEKKLEEEAETCFLSAVLHKQNWVEGWATMHLFYSQTGNTEGSELSLQMANRYLSSTNYDTDYFNSIDDLAWTTSICLNTVFFRTAVLLIKMRAFTYAEKALANELIKNPGICHYYVAVILYYKQSFTHALIHLKEAERIYGEDYGVVSLTGHCFLALRKLEKAKEQYMKVLESFNRPDDVHLLYLYLAVVHDRLGNRQAARKLLLVACKHSPTPYTWLTVGVLYYSQNDLLSAEQCLIQANLCDNRLPEIWGYLTIINLELHRQSEAELCYKQAKKNKMRDEELEKKIHKAMKSLMTEEDTNVVTR
ncbi:hypothetical protein ILUMI_03836 [Ignelater luminosus]|uniref:Tetratricopeptide repeat protein 18 n=1 Tax=Ignelater luminosus TaxID=2038154 RepID=A0A8K0DA16_IGNLU|nr:hypothetical protein ILUMI_03836 [Ignelater luminosus]